MKRTLWLFLVLIAAVCLASAASAALFSDLPVSHWAYPYVERAVRDGAVNGMGDGTYAPDMPVTTAQFCAMLTRAFLPEAVRQTEGDTIWYDPYLRAASETGLARGLTAPPAEPILRADMAQIIWNLIGIFGPEEDGAMTDLSIPDKNDIPEDRKEAVTGTYRRGILTGMDEKGTFGGSRPMTRAEAAAVFSRISDLIGGTKTGTQDGGPGEPPRKPETDPAEKTLTVNGQAYLLGMGLEELKALAGDPDEILPTIAGYDFYVFGTSDYAASFFLAGVQDERVVALCCEGGAFEYLGQRAGVVGGDDIASPNRSATFYFDKNDGYILHMVYLEERDSFKPTVRTGAEILAGESRVNFHLVNAFRAFHGVSPLLWDDAAARSARLHAEDMAANSYMAHASLDGRSPFDRMKAEGISYHAAAENINAGYRSGVESHAGWVSSTGHRSTMLDADYRYLGVGGGSNGELYRAAFSFTQNYWG